MSPRKKSKNVASFNENHIKVLFLSELPSPIETDWLILFCSWDGNVLVVVVGAVFLCVSFFRPALCVCLGQYWNKFYFYKTCLKTTIFQTIFSDPMCTKVRVIECTLQNLYWIWFVHLITSVFYTWGTKCVLKWYVYSLFVVICFETIFWNNPLYGKSSCCHHLTSEGHTA